MHGRQATGTEQGQRSHAVSANTVDDLLVSFPEDVAEEGRPAHQRRVVDLVEVLSARRLSAMHTGRLYHYAFIIIGAALVFGALMWLNAGGAH